MSKIVAIAKAEYGIAVRSKAFVIGILMMPILMGGGIAMQVLLKDHVDITDRKCAIVDRSGYLYAIIEAANTEREESRVFEISDEGSRNQVLPHFLLEEYIEDANQSQTDIEIELSQRIMDGELFAYLVIDKEIFDAEQVDDESGQSLAYHTETPTFEALPDWLQQVINDAVLKRRFEDAQVDQSVVENLSRRVRLTSLGLVEVSSDGEVKAAKRDNELQTVGVPMGAMMLLFMLVMMTTPALLNQVLEEKMQKISEVLISSVTPFQLLMGKLFGTVLVSLTLSALYLGGIHYVTWHFEVSELIDPSLYVWFFLLLVLALFMFGSIFSAIGAASSEIKDAQSLMTPAMLIVVLPLFFISVVIRSPSSTFSTVLSMFPPATPMIMMLRIAMPPGPPVWQIVVSILLTAVFTVVCVAAAGKIFRIGILSQGQAPSYARLLQWILSK